MDPLTTESALRRSLGVYEQHEGHCPKHRNNSENTLATSHHAGLCVTTGLQNLRRRTMVRTTVAAQPRALSRTRPASTGLGLQRCCEGVPVVQWTLRMRQVLCGMRLMELWRQSSCVRTDSAISSDSESLRSHQLVGIAAATGEQDKLRHCGGTLCKQTQALVCCAWARFACPLSFNAGWQGGQGAADHLRWLASLIF